MSIALFSHDQMYLSTADEDELPKILPPKRRRMIKEKVNTSAPTIGMERLMQEFPKHNWLETKYLTDETLAAQAESMSGQATPYQYQYEDAAINGDSTCLSQSDEAQNNGQCMHSNDVIEIQSEKQHVQNEGDGTQHAESLRESTLNPRTDAPGDASNSEVNLPTLVPDDR